MKGFLLGIALTLCSVLLYNVGKSILDGFLSWGESEIFSDQDVRQRITQRGIKLPEHAGRLYYEIHGFIDHSEYIAFSTTPQEAMQIAQAFALRFSEDPQFVDVSAKDIAKKTTIYPLEKTLYWDISDIKRRQIFEQEFVVILVDTEKGRVYITTWST